MAPSTRRATAVTADSSPPASEPGRTSARQPGGETDGPPAPAPARPDGLQTRKSAATRARLIDATIACLVKYGYAQTVTPLVAAEAGLSRGAMLHHFANGDALIQATIIELHERRLKAFRRAAEATTGDVRAMVRGYWRQLQKPGFIAFQELALAARTDAGLAAILLPLQAEFSARFTALAAQLYPEWTAEPDRLALAMALSQTLMEGIRMADLTGAVDPGQIEPLLDYLAASVTALRPTPQPDPAPKPDPAPGPDPAAEAAA